MVLIPNQQIWHTTRLLAPIPKLRLDLLFLEERKKQISWRPHPKRSLPLVKNYQRRKLITIGWGLSMKKMPLPIKQKQRQLLKNIMFP
nr:MAG TPA: hypothetical protein [Caudoviricetes sp.]